MLLFDRILAARGIKPDSIAAFLLPDYNKNYDPFLLPDMAKAVKRLIVAKNKQEKIVVYGDYDIDGLTATSLLLESLKSFGFTNVNSVIPSRFTDGYGLSIDAIENLSKEKVDLIITVDCGTQSKQEIIMANKLGIDVIVTDHHNPLKVQPPAVAVINPKRTDSEYPFSELAGVGVAFKLVQALQTKMNGLPKGHEKWLLDLVALGTVCDSALLVDENRIFVYWGIKVLSKQKRLGLKALMSVSDVNPSKINAKTLGFVLGPRMNAAGRLENAKYALDMLMSTDIKEALDEANHLDEMNIKRRVEQSEITKEAIIQADKYSKDYVLVLSKKNWNNGIVGIVASKILEKYQKPTIILQEIGDESKGSARSFGDFNIANAIESCKDIITSGGGHNFAAGVTLPTKNIELFRKQINKYYKNLKLIDQKSLLLPHEDTTSELNEINEEVVDNINQLEPFGIGNQQPILRTDNLIVKNVRRMGSDGQHVKLDLIDQSGLMMQFLSFNANDNLFVKVNEKINVWYHLDINEWQGRRSIEGRLLHLELLSVATN